MPKCLIPENLRFKFLAFKNLAAIGPDQTTSNPFRITIIEGKYPWVGGGPATFANHFPGNGSARAGNGSALIDPSRSFIRIWTLASAASSSCLQAEESFTPSSKSRIDSSSGRSPRSS